MTTRFRLREALETAKMSQADSSRESGVSLVTINKISKNKTTRVDLLTLDLFSALALDRPR